MVASLFRANGFLKQIASSNAKHRLRQLRRTGTGFADLHSDGPAAEWRTPAPRGCVWERPAQSWVETRAHKTERRFARSLGWTKTFRDFTLTNARLAAISERRSRLTEDDAFRRGRIHHITWRRG